MKNNSRLWRWASGGLFAAVLAVGACERAPARPGAFQGVVELDERLLGFETGGRVTAVLVQRGAQVSAGEALATLDDALERVSHESRQAEVEAVRARAALVRAGSRPEEIRAMAAQVRAAEANEALLKKNLARQRTLFGTGAVSQASLDEVESRLAGATAEREALDQRLRELKNGARKQEIQSAEAQVDAATTAVKLETERLARLDLHAVEAGTVLDVHVDPGEIVAPGTPVVTVADTSHPYVEVFVPQGELEGVRIGALATVRVDATSTPFAARVENVGRRTEFTPRYLFSERERPSLVVRVRVRVDDPEQRLHAGVPAFVDIDKGRGAP
jgi:HlyD family secretion protein